jgi:hypothetical protein
VRTLRARRTKGSTVNGAQRTPPLVCARKNRSPLIYAPPYRVPSTMYCEYALAFASPSPHTTPPRDDPTAPPYECIPYNNIATRRRQRVLSTTKMALQYIMANAKLYTPLTGPYQPPPPRAHDHSVYVYTLYIILLARRMICAGFEKGRTLHIYVRMVYIIYVRTNRANEMRGQST